MSKSPLDRAVIKWGWDPYVAGYLSAYIELMTQRAVLIAATTKAAPSDADEMVTGANALFDELGSHLLQSLRDLAADTDINKESVDKSIKAATEIAGFMGARPPDGELN